MHKICEEESRQCGLSVRRTAERVKGKVYKLVWRTAMMYGLEMVALTKNQKQSRTRLVRIGNEYIRGTKSERQG